MCLALLPIVSLERARQVGDITFGMHSYHIDIDLIILTIIIFIINIIVITTAIYVVVFLLCTHRYCCYCYNL